MRRFVVLAFAGLSIGQFMVPGSHALAAPRTANIVFSTTFDRPVCGDYKDAPTDQCEFGIQGNVWTSDGVVHLDRESLDGHHVHVGRLAYIPGARMCTRVTLTLPSTDGVPFFRHYIQLVQVTPEADRFHPAQVIEVRLYPDRRLAVGTFEGLDAKTTGQAPVDTPFRIVLCGSLGSSVTLSLRALGEKVLLRADTTTTKDMGPRQMIGGTLGTLAPFTEVADDWSIWSRTTRIRGDG